MKIPCIPFFRVSQITRLIIGCATLFGNSCSFQQQREPYAAVIQRQANFSPRKNFKKLPVWQQKALEELFIEEFYHLPDTPISGGLNLNNHNISTWEKAKKCKILPKKASDDCSSFFLNYSYGMWADIYEILKNNPTYLDGRGLIALCHYLTYLQYGDVCRPEESFFTEERLQELPIAYRRKKHCRQGIYSVKQ